VISLFYQFVVELEHVLRIKMIDHVVHNILFMNLEQE